MWRRAYRGHARAHEHYNFAWSNGFRNFLAVLECGCCFGVAKVKRFALVLLVAQRVSVISSTRGLHRWDAVVVQSNTHLQLQTRVSSLPHSGAGIVVSTTVARLPTLVGGG